MTMQVFEKYCEKEIIPAFRRRLALLPTGARGLLVLDGHSSRGSAKAMEQFNQIHVDVVTFVSHTSHVCQPLDLIIFGKFKEGLGHLPTSTAKQSLPHQRKIMLETASRALYSALYGPDVRSAFERAGIVPLSRKRVLEHKSVQDVIDEPTPVESLPRHRSGLDINNVILSSPELITKLKETESKRHPKPLLVPTKAPSAPASPFNFYNNNFQTRSRERQVGRTPTKTREGSCSISRAPPHSQSKLPSHFHLQSPACHTTFSKGHSSQAQETS